MKLRLMTVVALAAFASAAVASAAGTLNIGTVSSGQTGSVSLYLWGPDEADYGYWIENANGHEVARLDSFWNSWNPHIVWDSYGSGISGTVYQSYPGEFQWDIQGLPPGTYRLRYGGYGYYYGQWYSDLSPVMYNYVISFTVQ